MSMTNFRAVDMPGNANKPAAEPEKKPAAKKPAAAKKPVAEKVEVEDKEVVVEEDVVLEESKPTPKGKK